MHYLTADWSLLVAEDEGAEGRTCRFKKRSASHIDIFGRCYVMQLGFANKKCLGYVDHVMSLPCLLPTWVYPKFREAKLADEVQTRV